MQTTLNNFERVLIIIDSYSRPYYCNISQLNQVVKSLELREGYYNIYEIEKNKLKKVSRKNLDTFFAARDLKREFFY